MTAKAKHGRADRRSATSDAPARTSVASPSVRSSANRFVSDRPDGAVLVVAATPKAGMNAVGPVETDAIRVRVSAAAVDGAANAAIIELLADTVGVARTRVRVIAGQCARRKRVLFAGLTADELVKRLRIGGEATCR